jgi:hypothetical protein
MHRFLVTCLLIACGITQALAQQSGVAAPDCPPKRTNGAGIVSMRLMFSVSNPKQDVICAYSDGSIEHFEVDKGCNVDPTGVIADGMPSGSSAFTFGSHECNEDQPGAGKCHIVCRQQK